MYKDIPPLKRAILMEHLSEYEENCCINHSERIQLHRWIKLGNDINSNPWGYCYDEIWEMDFITALRMDNETYETMKRVAEES